MQTVQSDDETEYDVDGVYSAQDLANDLRLIIRAVRFEYEKRQNVTGQFDHITDLIERHLKDCEL